MNCRSILPVLGAGALMLGCLGKVGSSVKNDGPSGQSATSADDAGDGIGLLAQNRKDGSVTRPNQKGDASTQVSSDGSVVVMGTPDSSVVDSGSSVSLLEAGTPPPTPTPSVSDCNSLAAEGVFEDITPPEVKAGIAGGAAGTFAIGVDPVNQGTVYVGTIYQKLWKSVDCGANWLPVAMGKNGAQVNSGMNWTFVIDPFDTKIVYTNSGYGQGTNGLYKSYNGGVDWDLIWPPPSQPELAAAFQYNFANVLDMDPSNHLHLLLTFHETCLPPHASTCIAETTDAGATWRLIDGGNGWDGREGQIIFFLNDSNTWLWGSQSNGFYRTPDRGQTWVQIPKMTTAHLQGSQLLRTSKGFLMAGSDGIWRSPDGQVSTWTLVPGTGPIAGGLVSNGTNMFTSNCYFPDFCSVATYQRSPVTDGQTWTQFSSPSTIKMGGTMGYDKGHNLLYSSNGKSGMWRVVVR